VETGEENLMAASRKRRQGSRFLGRRLVQSSAVSAGVWEWLARDAGSLCFRVRLQRRAVRDAGSKLVARKSISHSSKESGNV
jgi:hypothetical protein